MRMIVHKRDIARAVFELACLCDRMGGCYLVVFPQVHAWVTEPRYSGYLLNILEREADRRWYARAGWRKVWRLRFPKWCAEIEGRKELVR